MPIVMRRAVISTGRVRRRGQVHAPKFPERARRGFIVPHLAVGRVWWSPLAKLRGLGAFDVIDIRRSPDRINGFEVEVSGTGRPGKVAVLVYAETFTAPTQRADAYTLDEDNDMSTVVQTAAGANATLNLPEAVRNLIGAEFIIRVNNAPNTLVIDSHVNDRIVRVSADRAEEEEKDKVQSNTANAFIVLACREAHRWIIEAETPRTATGALPWTLTN